MKKLYVDMNYDEKFEVRKRCYFSVMRVRKWRASEVYGGTPRVPLHSYPGENWRKELISILKPLLKYLPEYFSFEFVGKSAEELMEMTKAIDLDSATNNVINPLYLTTEEFYMNTDWAMNPKLREECESQSAENVIKVQEWLDDYKLDLLDAADVDVDNMNLKAIGKSLFALGFKKVRTGGKSPGQYLWILDNYEKYANLKPAELLKVWKEQTAQI